MLNYEDTIRLRWTPGALPAPEVQAELEASNLAVLQSVAAMEEGVSQRLREEQPELHHELERLGARLDLLLDLVGSLLQQRRSPVQGQAVVMAPDRIRFQPGDDPVEPDHSGRLTLYLHRSVPQPLDLAGTIGEVGPDQHGRVWAEFVPVAMSERLRDALGQHVFRHHRRMIAEQRARSSD